MEEFNGINEIITQTIKDSSYITVIISSTVFVLYTLIIKVVELLKSKNKNKPFLEMAASIKNVSENVVKLNSVLDKTFKDVEQKDSNRTKQAIDLGCKVLCNNIKSECTSIIVINNVKRNKDNIKANVKKLVSTEYYKLYELLSTYQINNVNIATKLKEGWIDELTKECLGIIYSEQDAIDRIRQLDNRLKLNAEEYSVYINNKVFNH